MTLRIVLAGASGKVGMAIVQRIAKEKDLCLAAAVSRSAAGRDAGEVAGIPTLGVAVYPDVTAAMAAGPADVLIDYTKPGSVKAHALAAIAHGLSVVIGTSGLTASDYEQIDAAARARRVGVHAAGNYSITATLMRRFALEAARFVPDVEIIDYAGPAKPDVPSGTGRELAEQLKAVRGPGTSLPVETLSGARETRGADIGGTRVHSVRMPGYLLSCEALFGLPDERLVIRHDSMPSPHIYVAGTLMAARRVREWVGLKRGLETVMD